MEMGECAILSTPDPLCLLPLLSQRWAGPGPAMHIVSGLSHVTVVWETVGTEEGAHSSPPRPSRTAVETGLLERLPG